MNAYTSLQYTRQHQAELQHEADQVRLAKVARTWAKANQSTNPTARPSRGRLALAIASGATAILATAGAILAGL